MGERVLVVGGTGPTGPLLIEGLLERGHDVVVFHRGTHELPELAALEHVHGDPFDRESLGRHLAGREFDIVLATYGRTRLVAEAVAGRCARLIAISGPPVYDGYLRGADPLGLAAPVREDDPRVSTDPGDGPYPVHLVRRTEDRILELGAQGAFAPTLLRYPMLYGPRVPHPWEWLVVRRVLDGRRFIILPDAGLGIHTRASVWNAAHCVLAAIDRPRETAGAVFNVGDDHQYTLAQWVGAAARAMGKELAVLAVPGEVASPGWTLFPFGYPRVSPHVILDTARARALLGYRDAVPPMDGLRRTVEWLVENAREVDAAQLPDAFDYQTEDRVALEYADSIERLHLAAAGFDDLLRYGTPQSGP